MSEDQDDLNLFKSAMSDVAPLAAKKQVLLKARKDDTPGLTERRRAAQTFREESAKGLSVEHIVPVEPLAVLSFVRPGVQQGVFKKLRLGKYAIDARLDLHGKTVKEARMAVLKLIKDCVKYDVRCALITHGKGIDRKPQPAILKSCIATWLPEISEILAFHTAQQQHGGAGSTYLLLRKSETKKQRNRERHLGRRG